MWRFYQTESHLFIPYIDKTEIYNTLIQIDKKYYLFRIFPFIGYGYYNFDWGIHSLVNQKLNLFPPLFKSNGDLRVEPNVNIKYVDKGRKAGYDYNLFINDYLIKIRDLVKNNNSKLITYTAPFYDKKNGKNNIDRLKITLNDNGITYYDYSTIYFKNKNYFMDNNHLNNEGSIIFSKVLANTIK